MERDVLKRSVLLWVNADQRTSHRVPHTVTYLLLGVNLTWLYR